MPLPSEVAASFGRVITEEDIPRRFLETAWECLASGLLADGFRRRDRRHYPPLAAVPARLRDLGGGLRLGAAGAGLSAVSGAVRPQRLTIIMLAFIVRAAAGHPQDHRRAFGDPEGAGQCRTELQAHAGPAVLEDLFPSALPTIFVGIRLGLIFALINVVGVEFLINFGGLGQLINELAERYDLPGVYAAICFVILVSVIFFID